MERRHGGTFFATAFLGLVPQAGDGAPVETETLYERLGGVYAIATFVDDFVDRLNANDVLNANPAIDRARREVPAPGLKFAVTQLVCQAAGGPQVYTGRSLEESHAHLGIGETEWDAMVADLQASFEAFDVPEAEREELVEILGATKPDVLGPPQPAAEPSSFEEGHEGEEGSLYERLGRVYPIAVLVDDFVDRLTENDVLNANPAIDRARREVPAPGLKYMVTEYVAAAIGGPQVYTGRSMEESHAHLGIGETEWEAMVADLHASFEEFDVPEDLRAELLEVLGSTEDEIVQE